MLGWTAPDRVAVLVPDPPPSADPDDTGWSKYRSTGAIPRQLSAVPTSGGAYGIGRYQLATGFLPDLEVGEAGEVDQSRWPLWLRLGAAVTAGAVAARAARFVRRRVAP